VRVLDGMAGRAGGWHGRRRPTQFIVIDASVHLVTMETSHISLVWKYFTVDVAYACVLALSVL